MNPILLVNFRKYQEDMLTVFDQLLSRGDRKFHFVAPPGSGKTLIGLELTQRLGEKAVVFSPTVAIQRQWMDVYRTYIDGATVSLDPYSDADLVSLTYQLISVKAKGSSRLHPNVKALFAAIAGRKTIIFDECHHLTSEWARILSRLDTPDRRLIALTATPPIDREPKAREVYERLLGPVSYEIPLPPVVKEGYLAPYQDLVYLTAPTDHEVALIDRLCAPYRKLMRELIATNDITPVHFWAAQRLDDYRDGRGRPVAFDQLFRTNPQFCLAASRFVLANGSDLPLSVIFMPEMEDPLSFPDVLTVVEDYTLNYLSPLTRAPHDPQARIASQFARDIKIAFKEVGYALTDNGFHPLGSGIRTILGKSRGKILALKPILAREMIHQGDDFSCLILTDYEQGDERDGTSALEVLRYLTEDPETDAADPILLTGRSVLVDDDLLEDFIVCADAFFEREGLDLHLTHTAREGFFEIGSDSSLWSTRIYVPLITYILERGLTRCLVSTKAMLGEGWNSIRLNTLIDLTIASGYAFVNQMRGRTLRLDPARPLKVANNWDIAAILPDPDQGAFDLDRLRRKYSQFFGMGSSGSVERGLGHLHPSLADRTIAPLHAARDRLNRDMLDRASDRRGVYKSWNIGAPYRNAVLHCLDLTLPYGEEDIENTLCSREASRVFQTIQSRVLSLRTGLYPLGFFSLFAGYIALFPHTFSAFLLYVIATILVISSFSSILKPGSLGRLCAPLVDLSLRKYSSFRHLLERLCLVVAVASDEKDPQLILEKSPSSGIRLFSRNEALSPIIARSVADMLSPPARRKYVLRSAPFFSPREGVELWKWLTTLNQVMGPKTERRAWINIASRLDRYRAEKDPSFILIPVPEEFSRRREDAERFLSAWRHHIAPARLIGLKSREYPETVLPHARKKLFPIQFRLVELWV